MLRQPTKLRFVTAMVLLTAGIVLLALLQLLPDALAIGFGAVLLFQRPSAPDPR